MPLISFDRASQELSNDTNKSYFHTIPHELQSNVAMIYWHINANIIHLQAAHIVRRFHPLYVLILIHSWRRAISLLNFSGGFRAWQQWEWEWRALQSAMPLFNSIWWRQPAGHFRHCFWCHFDWQWQAIKVPMWVALCAQFGLRENMQIWTRIFAKEF